MHIVTFISNSILLGVGLAMDAFSVSIANGLSEPAMTRRRECLIAGTYGVFQFLMPVIGWGCVHALVRQFRVFETFIPWIALVLLLWIGGKMLREGIGTRMASRMEPAPPVPDGPAPADRPGGVIPDTLARPDAAAKPEAALKPDTAAIPDAAVIGLGTLLLQGIATSIDALSVGFAIAEYSAAAAITAALIIAAVTFVICMGGLTAGKRLGMRLAGRADILGGCILIFIGIEIFIRGVFL